MSKNNRQNQDDDEFLNQDESTDQSNNEESDSDSQVEELNAELKELQEKYLRLFAEFDNYKKRSLKEKVDMSKRAGQEVITALLPVLDDFDRASKIADDPDSYEYYREGMELVYNKLYQVLQQQGLKAMDITNNEFDPELHNAIANLEVEDESLKGKILDYIEKGYLLNDKIIRHAKVVVGKK